MYTYHPGGEAMGKISPKSSYKNMIKANKTDNFFANRQANKVIKSANKPKVK